MCPSSAPSASSTTRPGDAEAGWTPPVLHVLAQLPRERGRGGDTKTKTPYFNPRCAFVRVRRRHRDGNTPCDATQTRRPSFSCSKKRVVFVGSSFGRGSSGGAAGADVDEGARRHGVGEGARKRGVLDGGGRKATSAAEGGEMATDERGRSRFLSVVWRIVEVGVGCCGDGVEIRCGAKKNRSVVVRWAVGNGKNGNT